MTILKFAAIAIAVPAMVAAQPAPTTDGDKPVTIDAINARLDADFADLDGDGNGSVTPAEINARLVKSAEAEVAAFRKKRDEAFAKYDTDGNGAISKAEFEARTKLPSIREPDPKPFLDRFDADKDGLISKEEFRAPTLANFERLDANRDGTVSPDESSDEPAAPEPRASAALAQPDDGPGKATDTSAAAASPPLKKPEIKKTPPIGR